MPRNWHTANQGWVDVDPSGNKMNKKAAKEAAKEAAKWQTMTKAEYEEWIKKNKAHGVNRVDSNTYEVKTKR
jgi:hypothetical protein